MKKITALILSLLMLLTLLPAAAFADIAGAGTQAEPWLIGKTNEDDVTAYLDKGTLIISGTGYMKECDNCPWEESRSSITKVVIGSGVTSIGGLAFKNCANLSSVSIPEGMEYINESAFMNCSSLEEVTLPSTVTFIGQFAFDNSGLTSLTVKAATPPTLDSINAFVNCPEDLKIYVPEASVEAYQKAQNWADLADMIQPIPEEDPVVPEGLCEKLAASFNSVIRQIISFVLWEKFEPAFVFGTVLNNIRSIFTFKKYNRITRKTCLPRLQTVQPGELFPKPQEYRHRFCGAFAEKLRFPPRVTRNLLLETCCLLLET